MPCFYKCTYCSEPLNENACLGCYDGEFLMPDGELNEGSCNAECGEGYFADTFTNICLSCDASCKYCS